MSTVVLAVAGAAAVACPGHMLWRMRRGREPTCDPGRSRNYDIAAVRRRQRDLEARIAERTAQHSDEDQANLPVIGG